MYYNTETSLKFWEMDVTPGFEGEMQNIPRTKCTHVEVNKYWRKINVCVCVCLCVCVCERERERERERETDRQTDRQTDTEREV